MFGWVQDIAIDNESALPQQNITASEGEAISLNVFFLRNGLSNQDIIHFEIDSTGTAMGTNIS